MFKKKKKNNIENNEAITKIPKVGKVKSSTKKIKCVKNDNFSESN